MHIENLGDVTEANVAAALRTCARNLPGDDKPDSQTWGAGACSALVDAAAGTPLARQIDEALDGLLRAGDDDEVELAVEVMTPARASVDALEQAIARTDLAPKTRERALSALGRALAAQPARYVPSRHRALASGPGRDAFVGAILVGDHDYFLQHLQALLGTAPSDAAGTLWSALYQVNDAEADALRDELRARRATLGDAYVDELLAAIDGEMSRADHAVRGGPMRWRP